jgi:hypothetical protein
LKKLKNYLNCDIFIVKDGIENNLTFNYNLSNNKNKNSYPLNGSKLPTNLEAILP